MSRCFFWNKRLMAAVAVLSLGLGLGVAHADTASASATDSGNSPRGERVDQRIAKLHSELGITPAEEHDWDAVAQVMRDNAAEMQSLNRDRKAHIDTMTALDSMTSYQKIAQAHADEAQKLTVAFTTLYNSMSDDQKKNADEIFRSMNQRHHKPKHQ